jgi:hypothetical protein
LRQHVRFAGGLLHPKERLRLPFVKIASMNPYESPRVAPRSRQRFSLRLILLIPAVLLFALAAIELFKYFEVVERGKRSARRLPPTMYSQHSGAAFAFGALGLACVVSAFRKSKAE